MFGIPFLVILSFQESMAEEIESEVAGLVGLVRGWIEGFDLAESTTGLLTYAVILGGVLVLCALAYIIVRKVLTTSMGYVAEKSRTEWDDILLEKRVFIRISYLAPALVVYFFAAAFPGQQDWIQRLALVYMVLVGVFVVNAFLSAVNAIYRTTVISRSRPIKGFVQVARILLFCVGVVFVLSTLMNRSPWGLLSGIGALTAVLLIVFKDSLLGLVASFQITSTNMVREGDWIEMQKFGADGDVIDVSLHTIKVRNWDKTITTIPTYALVSDSFKNWRGMEESGGRRIKRSLIIDMNSIRFCTDEMLDRFEKIHAISDYVREKRKELAEYNRENSVDVSEIVNGRRLTNLGTFRAYVVAYLRNHPQVNQEMTFLVRHIQPTENGLPFQVYVFSKIQSWAEYEAIQADIFDHLFAVLPEFGLRVFQRGSDYKELEKAEKNKP